MHYPGNNNVEVSYGIIKEGENEYDFNHTCDAGKYSSGGPILNLFNNKLIGMHKGGNRNKDTNLGIFLKYAILIVLLHFLFYHQLLFANYKSMML